jgi:hypothetical protein
MLSVLEEDFARIPQLLGKPCVSQTQSLVAAKPEAERESVEVQQLAVQLGLF